MTILWYSIFYGFAAASTEESGPNCHIDLVICVYEHRHRDTQETHTLTHQHVNL